MINSPRPKIGAGASAALDALRLAAALVVVVFHASSQWTTAYPATHAALGKASHAAVVVFFVISGYVIAFTTAGSPRSARQYAVARLSRLYAVLVPALLLTAAVEYLVVRSDAALTARYVHEHSGVRYLLTALFCNEVGFFSAGPPLNSPLWSLSYEFWYYVLFGIWHYGRGRRGAWLWLAAAGLVAGPKVLLLLPIWLMGVGAYLWAKPAWVANYSWLWTGGWLTLASAAVVFLPALPVAVGAKPLFMAGQFATDWVVGALFGLAVWSLPAGSRPARPVGGSALRTAADLSFPVYALHFPLLVLGQVVAGKRVNDVAQMGVVVVGVLAAASLLGWLCDTQRTRWRRLFAWLLRVRSPAR